MLTSAGVSATDGNHQLHAGLWKEWRSLIRDHYGGIDSVFTGWVSNTMYEPSVGEKYWRQLADAEANLEIMDNSTWADISYHDKWIIELDDGLVSALVLVDGTDLGDVSAQVGVDFDLGMDAKSVTNESIAPEIQNDIIQDLTFAAILKDYGGPGEHLLTRPEHYDSELFRCACKKLCPDGKHDCETMLSYGRLPNDKYMINWPIHGNDTYLNMIDMSFAERQTEIERAKQHTLDFIYFIQHDLGFVNLGLADDEFPTTDRLPLMPYHREGRRIKGLSRFTLNHMLHPFASELYKSGVAVGDYPVDHHHDMNSDSPSFDFPSVPSFSIPIGSLIPKNIDFFVVADKTISVSNIANGSTRLQPVIIQIGQAAGLIAAISAKQKLTPSELDIRDIQKDILDYNGYLLPYIDVGPDDPDFVAIQKIAATGILKGRPVPYKWANQTWFDPDSLVNVSELISDLQAFDTIFQHQIINELKGDHLSAQQLNFLLEIGCRWLELGCAYYDFDKLIPEQITRRTFAQIFDKIIHPFELKGIDFQGNFTETFKLNPDE